MTKLVDSTAYGRSAKPGESWWYLGHLVTGLATSSETNGQLSAVEAVMRKGGEPPAHIHNNEDEAYYVTEGHFTFEVGHSTIDAPKGTFVWLPRGISHTFEVDRDGATALILVTPGGFLEAMFAPFSEPAMSLELPSPPDDAPWSEILDLDRRLGVDYPEIEASP